MCDLLDYDSLVRNVVCNYIFLMGKHDLLFQEYKTRGKIVEALYSLPGYRFINMKISNEPGDGNC